MIDKRELRYGNLVYTWDTDYEFGGTNQFLEQVEEVRKNVVEFKTSHAAYNEIEPIELTPEWLERCGCVKCPPSEDRWQYELELPNNNQLEYDLTTLRGGHSMAYVYQKILITSISSKIFTSP